MDAGLFLTPSQLWQELFAVSQWQAKLGCIPLGGVAGGWDNQQGSLGLCDVPGAGQGPLGEPRPLLWLPWPLYSL